MRRSYQDFVHRGVLAVAILSLFLGVAYIAREFIPVFVYAVFLYYAVRPVHEALATIRLPRRIRAGISILIFGLPFVFLIAYAFVVITTEFQSFLNQYDSQEQLFNDLFVNQELLGMSEQEIHSLLMEVQRETDLSDGIASVTGVVSRVSSAFVQLLVLLALTFSMLSDGPRLKAWVIENADQNGVFEEFINMVDRELASTLFGNIVNVFVTCIIAVTVFSGFNYLAPPVIHVPLPGLLGALAGLGSLIPVIGIKLVYIPVTAWLAANAWVIGDSELLIMIFSLLIVSAVLIDFIPDMFIRAIVSGDATHTGVLVAAYIIGPTVLGFYGLFLAPILLVLLISTAHVLVPYVVYGEKNPPQQATLGTFNTHDEPDANVTSSWYTTSRRVWYRLKRVLQSDEGRL